MIRSVLTTIALCSVLFALPTKAEDEGAGTAIPVELGRSEDGAYQLMRGGEPYVVRGAGVGKGDLKLLKDSGGNSIRTWGIDQLEDEYDGKHLLDRAQELGMTVSLGIWVEHPRHGFDYSDEAFIESQRAMVRETVLKYKDHPALLMWGLGNEMEAFGDEAQVELIWQEVNHLAGMIKELDDKHPVSTTISGATPKAIQGINSFYPNLDILGVNAYGAASWAGKNLPQMGWDGPYLLTEYGVLGTWEVPVTSWNAPIEPDPSTKSAQYYSAYKTDRDENQGRSLGSYVFFWGQKQEATETWFGMFLETGEKLPQVDAMAFAWTGKWPANRTPKMNWLDSPVALKSVLPGTSAFAEADVVDREGDELNYVWDIREESSDRRQGGDLEAKPPSLPEAILSGQGTARITFNAPENAGAYRIFLTVYDGQGGAVSHNLPFFVE